MTRGLTNKPAGESHYRANLTEDKVRTIRQRYKPMATDCCGYLPKNGDGYPVKWNQYNRVVQCHNCGTVWKPEAANA